MLSFIICVVLACLLEWLCSNFIKSRFDTLSFLAFAMPVSEICKQIILYRHNGFYDWWYFPFQLCSMIMYLLPIRQICKNQKLNRYIDSFLIDFGFVAGLAVFIDQSGLHYNLAVLTLHSYIWHTIMIFVAIHLARRTEELHFFKAVAVYLSGVAIATIINTVFRGKGSINMFYISPYVDMGQAVFRQIATLTTQATAKVRYVLATVTAAGTVNKAIKRLH